MAIRIWDGGTTYYLGDLVSRNDVVYRCLVESSIGEPPESNLEKWGLWYDAIVQNMRWTGDDPPVPGDLLPGQMATWEKKIAVSYAIENGDIYTIEAGEGGAGPAAYLTVQGPPGRAAVVWRRKWSADTVYSLNEGVSWNGTSFVSLADNNQGFQPDDPANIDVKWQVLAQGGVTSGYGTFVAPYADHPAVTARISTEANQDHPMSLTANLGLWIRGDAMTVVSGGTTVNAISDKSAAARPITLGNTLTRVAGLNKMYGLDLTEVNGGYFTFPEIDRPKTFCWVFKRGQGWDEEMFRYWNYYHDRTSNSKEGHFCQECDWSHKGIENLWIHKFDGGYGFQLPGTFLYFDGTKHSLVGGRPVGFPMAPSYNEETETYHVAILTVDDNEITHDYTASIFGGRPYNRASFVGTLMEMLIWDVGLDDTQINNILLPYIHDRYYVERGTAPAILVQDALETTLGSWDRDGRISVPDPIRPQNVVTRHFLEEVYTGGGGGGGAIYRVNAGKTLNVPNGRIMLADPHTVINGQIVVDGILRTMVV